MKKLALTIAIVLGLGMATFANPDEGGLFQRGTTPANESLYGTPEREGLMPPGPGLPGHGSNNNNPAPLGSGIAVLLGLGAAYMVGKKRREE